MSRVRRVETVRMPDGSVATVARDDQAELPTDGWGDRTRTVVVQAASLGITLVGLALVVGGAIALWGVAAGALVAGVALMVIGVLVGLT